MLGPCWHGATARLPWGVSGPRPRGTGTTARRPPCATTTPCSSWRRWCPQPRARERCVGPPGESALRLLLSARGAGCAGCAGGGGSFRGKESPYLTLSLCPPFLLPPPLPMPMPPPLPGRLPLAADHRWGTQAQVLGANCCRPVAATTVRPPRLRPGVGSAPTSACQCVPSPSSTPPPVLL